MPDTTFSHIKVTFDEDDEVIEAGLPPDCGPQTTPSSKDREQTLDSKMFSPAQNQNPQPQSPPASKATKTTVKQPPEDGFHETTLEDLQSTSMPFAQKIVIVAAVICIIGAIVYYFVAMR